MKVKIIRSSKTTYWYANKIGNTYDVINHDDEHLYRVNGDMYPVYINKDDCVVVTPTNNMPPSYVKVLRGCMVYYIDTANFNNWFECLSSNNTHNSLLQHATFAIDVSNNKIIKNKLSLDAIVEGGIGIPIITMYMKD